MDGWMEMAESITVTEGLGSAMLSIWLRDVQCSSTVLQHMNIGITQHTCINLCDHPLQEPTHHSINRHSVNNCTDSTVLTAAMRLVSVGVRARRAAEPSEPESEEATEPAHHEHSHSEHHEHAHTEHHDYNNMKEKFMNELSHLPSKSSLESATC